MKTTKSFEFLVLQAYSVATTLQAKLLSIATLFKSNSNKKKNKIHPCLYNAKPCHCNYLYNLRTRLILLINHFIPRCPYYTTYFAFRRTGVHPPL